MISEYDIMAKLTGALIGKMLLRLHCEGSVIFVEQSDSYTDVAIYFRDYLDKQYGMGGWMLRISLDKNSNETYMVEGFNTIDGDWYEENEILSSAPRTYRQLRSELLKFHRTYSNNFDNILVRLSSKN